MTNTVDLRVDGDSIDIEVESLSPIEEMLWAGRAPDIIKGEPDEVQASEEVIEFLIDLTVSQTILTRELLEEIPRGELQRLFNGVSMYAFDGDGELPERGAESHRVDTEREIEWNDDGSLDLEDWR